MDMMINAPIIGKGDFLVCVGGGRWGTKGATIAKKAGARVVVIDLSQDCLASGVADAILAEKDMRGAKIEGIVLVIGEVTGVLANILKYGNPQWIIPAIPGGIASKLTEKWLTTRRLKITKRKFLVKRALAGLPQKLVLAKNSGTIISSYMPKGMRCEIPCSQPKICPVTGRNKVAPMHVLLEFSLSEVVDHYKIFVSRDLGGVGVVSGAEVKEWLEYIERLEPPYSLAVAISCGCHANTALFEVEETIEGAG
jgi:hypothetical protein